MYLKKSLLVTDVIVNFRENYNRLSKIFYIGKLP